MAGLVQLKTSGPQDRFFTDDPEFTYFVKNFKKHENFSRFYKDLDFEGNVEFGEELRCTIPQNQGDLIKGINLKFELEALDQGLVSGYSNIMYNETIGHAVIEYAELYIGGALVQRINSDMLSVYSENYVTQTHQSSISRLIGKPETQFSTYKVNRNKVIGEHLVDASKTTTPYFVEIPFYFHNNPELAVPIYAIDKQEVEVVIKLRDVKDLIYGTKINPASDDLTDMYYLGESPKKLIKSMSLSTEFVLLDNKKNFPKRVDYVITQAQQNTFDLPANIEEHNVRLQFKNPIKEMFFFIQRKNDRVVGSNTFVSVFDYDSNVQTTSTDFTNFESLKNLELTLDGNEVLDNVTGDVIHLRAIQSGIHHSRTQLVRRYYTYSFALEPEKWYPTGQIDFSYIKDQNLKVRLHEDPDIEKELRVYAISYNILRVENGTTSILFDT